MRIGASAPGHYDSTESPDGDAGTRCVAARADKEGVMRTGLRFISASLVGVVLCVGCLAGRTSSETLRATPQTFRDRVAALVPGNTLVLLEGDYGDVTLDGTAPKGTGWDDRRRITLAAQPGKNVTFTSLKVGGGNKPCYVELKGIRVRVASGGAAGAIRVRDCSHVRLTDMDIRGFWSVNNFAGQTGAGIQLGTTATGTIGYIEVQGCEVSHASRGISVGGHWLPGKPDEPPVLVLRNNTIHDFGSTAIGLNTSRATWPTHGRFVVEGNHCYRKHVGINYVRLTGDLKGTFTVGERVTQPVAGGTMTGTVSRLYPDGRIAVRPTHGTLSFELRPRHTEPKPVVAAGGARLSNPRLHSLDASHGSGAAVRVGNCLLARNVFRDLGPTNGLRLYGSKFTETGGFCDVAITDNLFYDTINSQPVVLADIGRRVVFSRNTVVSRKTSDAATPGRYGAAVTLHAARAGGGAGLTMERNVLVGTLNVSKTMTGAFVARNNLLFSCIDNRDDTGYVDALGAPEDHNVILRGPDAYRAKGFTFDGVTYDAKHIGPRFFDTEGLFFAGDAGRDFETWHAKGVSKEIQPYAGAYPNRPHGVNLNDAYKRPAKNDAPPQPAKPAEPN